LFAFVYDWVEWMLEKLVMCCKRGMKWQHPPWRAQVNYEHVRKTEKSSWRVPVDVRDARSPSKNKLE
jgi:hypothetical protein